MRIDIYLHLDAPQLQEIHTTLEKLVATQAELAATLSTVTDTLTAIGSEVDKIGTETESLQKQITDLQALVAQQGGTTPEVDSALVALQNTATSLAARVQNVDNLVPDGTTP